jgi:nitrogen regulatory protein P-II 1
MKRIEAIVQPSKIDEVKEALFVLGLKGFTITEVRGFGRQPGHKAVFRGSEYRVDFVPKAKIEVVVSDSSAGSVEDAISRVARTGELGDGMIFVQPLDGICRIRTGETGEDAL